MEQPDIPTYILITAIGVVMLAGLILFALASNYLRAPVTVGPLRRVAEAAPNSLAPNAPAGSMAERRQNIEELLQRKERESQDA
jgi:hypothetical protein